MFYACFLGLLRIPTTLGICLPIDNAQAYKSKSAGLGVQQVYCLGLARSSLISNGAGY